MNQILSFAVFRLTFTYVVIKPLILQVIYINQLNTFNSIKHI